MRSRIFSFDMIKSASKKQLWIPSVLALGFFMAFPVAELIMLDEWETLKFTSHQMELLYENLWRDGLVTTGFAVIAAAALLNAVHGFGYLYSSRRVDFYHSLPIKRSELFWQQVWTGLLYTAAPYGAMLLAAVCAGGAKGYFSAGLVGRAASLAVIHLFLYFLVYFSAVLVIVLTGRYLPGALLLGVLFLYGPALALLIRYYRELFYSTAYIGAGYGIAKALMEYLSPLSLGCTLLSRYIRGESGGILAAVVLTDAVLGGLSLFAYRKRASESAGASIPFPGVAKLVKFLLVPACGMSFGIILSTVAGRGMVRTAWWIFGLVLGTVLSHGILEALYQSEFRKFFSKKAELALAGVLVLFCSLWYRMDLGKFDSYFPEREDIKELRMNIGYINNGYSGYFRKNGEKTYDVTYSWNEEERSLIPEGEQLGEDFYNILEEIASSQKETQALGYPARNLVEVYSIPVRYTLSSGKVIYREYAADKEQLRRLVLAGFEETTLREQKYSVLCVGDECLEGQTVAAQFASEDRVLLKNQTEKYRELLDALKLDVEEASGEELLEQPVASLLLHIRVPYPEDVSRLVPGKEESVSYNDVEVCVCPAFKRTIAFLEDMGCSLEMEKIDSLEVHYNKVDEYDAIVEEKETFDDPSRLEEMKACLVPFALQQPWIEYEDRAWGEFLTEKGERMSVGFLKEQMPDFLAERIEEKVPASEEEDLELQGNAEDVWMN